MVAVVGGGRCGLSFEQKATEGAEKEETERVGQSLEPFSLFALLPSVQILD